jgi:hypothetical protein
MKSIKTCSIKDLNRETREYLQGVWRRRGAGYPGVFIGSHRLWWCLVGCLAGVGLLGAAWHGLRPDSLYGSLSLQCLALALGAACLAALAPVLRRQMGSDALGNFAYCDGTWHWDVGPYRVGVTDLSQMSGVRFVDHFREAGWVKTVAHLALAENEEARVTFSDRQTALRFAAFLQVCLGIRRQAVSGQLSPQVRQFLSAPGGLAQAARAILDHGGQHVTLEQGKTIPIPDPTRFPVNRMGWGWLAGSVALAGLVFVAGWVGCPPLRQAIDHHHHYAMVQRGPGDDVQWPQAYLAKYPDGRYRKEVTAILDDRLFTNASRSATQQRSPAPLRGYLAGQPNRRHQDEALRIISRFYDEAIARVRALAAGQPTDHELLAGLLATLEHLKTQATPRVTVTFEPKWTVEPDDELVKAIEQEYQSALARKDGVIERMVRAGGTAIIGTHDTFSEHQVRRRESLILSRLQDAVANILSSDLIVFRQCSPTETSDIAIHYEIKPRGALTKYVRVPGVAPMNQTASLRGQGMTTNTIGLLREYRIDWRLTIQPGSTGTAYTYNLRSNAGTNLVYRAAPGDPDWGVYSVLMYSAFYDFSNRMLSGVGLNPPPAPTLFTFYDAVRR